MGSDFTGQHVVAGQDGGDVGPAIGGQPGVPQLVESSHVVPFLEHEVDPVLGIDRQIGRGGETALGAIHRLAIRAASPDTMYRLEILRAIAARDDLQSPEITSIHIVTGRADAGESVADEETRSLVRSFRLPPASPVALLLAPGEGRARIPAENDVVIVRDALGYRLDTADESYSLGDGPVIVFELADQEGVRVLSPWTDIPSVPLGDPREDVSLEISAGALARIVQIEE